MMRVARALGLAFLASVMAHSASLATDVDDCLVLGRTVAVRDSTNDVIFSNMAAVLADVGICVRDRQMPAKRVSESLLQGEVDGELMRIAGYVSVVGHTAFAVDEPISAITGYLVTRDRSVTSIDDIGGMSLAVVRGILWQSRLGNQARREIVTNTPQQQVEIFRSGRVDAILMDGVNFDAFPDLKDTHRVVVAREEVFIYLHRRWIGLAETVAEAIRSFKRRGCLFELPRGGADCRATASNL